MTQRRPGLHTDAHINPDIEDARIAQSKINRGNVIYRWGAMRSISYNDGGIFLASNVADTAAVWNAKVSQPGIHGDCENLREELESGLYMKEVVPANTLYWIHDLTPHEALPMATAGYRQFFRLVSSEVGVWYSQHSTPNPEGVEAPGFVSDMNKFGTGLK